MLEELFIKLAARVTTIMNSHDGSHDMSHIKRVKRNAEIIQGNEQVLRTDYVFNSVLVNFGSLLHDIGDKKYAQPGQDVTTMVNDLVLECVLELAPNTALTQTEIEFAKTLQKIATGVSYTAEVADPEAVRKLIEEVPELAIVQDADRLDSIGAVGLGRTFLYSGAHDMPLQASRELIDSRLSLIVGMMKTETGKSIAKERMKRLKKFRTWWDEESGGISDSKFD